MAKVRSLPEKNYRAVGRQRRLRGLLCAAAAVATAAPLACLSDVTLPDCIARGVSCVGEAGQSSPGPDASTEGGSAGVLVIGGGAGRVDNRLRRDGGGVGTQGDGGAGGEAGASGAAGASGEAGEAGALPHCGSCVILPVALPDPCSSVSGYSAALSISGGKAPYQWSVSATNGTWQIDPDPYFADTRHVVLRASSAATAGVTVRVQVTDDLGFAQQMAYSLAPRAACYFAYVEAGSAGGKLDVLDPLLETAPSHPLAHNQGVYDFQFSPDGHYLAYRYGQNADHPKGAHLSLVDLSSWQERPIALLEDEVTAFAWSKDARVLAVSYVVAGHTYLGGVRIDASTSALFAPLTSVLSSTAVESNLYWVGADFVAFYAVLVPATFPPGIPYDLITGYYAPFGAAGFEAPMPISDTQYDVPVVVQPTDAGFFLTSPPDSFSAFNGLGTDNVFELDHGTDVIAPSGHYTANIDANDALELFSPSAFVTVPPIATSQTSCSKLLTWAAKRERIACVADVSDTNTGTTHGEIRIFDLSSGASPVLSASTLEGACVKNASGAPVTGSCATDSYDYDQGSSTYQPRLLSPSGRWLAFATSTSTQDEDFNVLYWADLSQQPMHLSRRQVSIGTAMSQVQTAFVFSPNEQYLLQRQEGLLAGSGEALFAYHLTAAANDVVDSAALAIGADLMPDALATTPCSDDFVSAPDHWCGTADTANSFIWSPDSKLIAYRSKLGLTVVALRSTSAFETHPFIAGFCADTCSGQFAFQPQNLP